MIKKICVLFAITAALLAGCKSDSPVTPTNTNHAPNAPSDPTPSNGATNVHPPVTISWNCSDPDAGDALSYDIYEGTSNPPSLAVATNVKNKTFNLGLISSNTLIYWRIVAKDDKGGSTQGPVWSFRTN